MRRSFLFSSASTLAFAALLLAGCAVGPDFETPPAPDVTGYDQTAPAEQTGEGAQALKPGQDIPAAWWALFHSDDLNALVVQAIKDNPDLASAEASLRVAQDNLAAGSTALFPTVTGSFSSQREKLSGASYGSGFPSSIFTLHNASVSASYTLDVFGGTRREIEELQAQADEAKFEKEAAYISLTSNVVTAAIQEASLRAQIEATRAVIEDEEKNLKILQARFDAGAVARSALALQQASVATAKTNLPPLEHQLVVTRHSLTALIGQMPQKGPGAAFDLSKLVLPQEIPLSVPSKLVEQRPDIREAEENLHSASAAIGVAVAARLPEITLSADIGSVAGQVGKLFSPGGGFWAFGGNAAETLFDAGALADREDAARANYDLAAAQYRKTVLAAFQDVADSLHALQSDAENLNAEIEAEKAASISLELAHAQLQAGAITIADLLTAEQTEQQAKAALAKARAQRYADTAALFTALGGGWWNREAQPLNPPASADAASASLVP